MFVELIQDVENIVYKSKQLRPVQTHMSHIVRKRDYCLWENKGTDQLCSNCPADQSPLFSLHE